MKRKVTKLEQRLIDKGYSLSHKVYGGKHSQKTLFYYYVSQNKFVKLDYTRENVVSWGLLNYSTSELTTMTLQGVAILLDLVKQDLKDSDKGHTYKELSPSEYDESEELGDMNFEQFDMLCKEREND